jgi:hypothetical protein
MAESIDDSALKDEKRDQERKAIKERVHAYTERKAKLKALEKELEEITDDLKKKELKSLQVVEQKRLREKVYLQKCD